MPPAELAVALQGELRLPVLEMLRESVLRRIGEHSDRQFIGLGGDQAARSRGSCATGSSCAVPPRQVWRSGSARSPSTLRPTTTIFVGTVRTGRLSEAQKVTLGSYAALTHQLQGEFVRLEGGPVATALARFIRESHATEVILGHRRRGRWKPRDTSSELIRLLEGADVHILRTASSSPAA